MIPKIIHYCWFGRAPLPDKAKKCIESWRKHCPNYTILEWNEDNFDIHQNGYTEMCCKEKKYAFLADYARLQIIENEGGFYFDVDVELVRSLDPLCSEHAFFAFETDRMIATGLGFGAEKHHPLVHFMLEQCTPARRQARRHRLPAAQYTGAFKMRLKAKRQATNRARRSRLSQGVF